MDQLIFDVVWHQEKARRNIAKHGVSFVQAATVMLDSRSLTIFDRRNSDEEDRWFTIGKSRDGRVLAISHTYGITEKGSIQIRIISARKASNSEVSHYRNAIE